MSERRVWLVQCLCGPARHCISALAGEAEDRADAEVRIEAQLRRDLARLIEEGILEAHCGICGATAASWHYEPGRTRWRNMAEAEPGLRQAETANALAALIFGGGTSGPRH